MYYQDKYVITGPARVIWNGVTKPEPGENGGGPKYTLKVAMPAHLPEKGELDHIVNQECLQSDFKGTLPPGAIPAMTMTQAGEFGDMIPNHVVFNSVTYDTPPDVYDANGNKLDPVHYGQMLYPGATVQVIVAARSYNNKSKGLGFWLNGIKIVDATTPQLPVGGGRIDAGAVFGSGGGSAPSPSANTAQAPGAAVAPSATPDTTAPAASFAAPGSQPQPAGQAPGAVPQAPGAAPAPAPQQPLSPDQDFLTVQGQQYSVAQLRAAKWSEEQIAAAR